MADGLADAATGKQGEGREGGETAKAVLQA